MNKPTLQLLLLGLAPAILALGAAAASEEPSMSDDSTANWTPDILIQMRSSDLERTIVFYRDVLGMELVEHNRTLAWVKFQTVNPDVRVGLALTDDGHGSGTMSINLGVRGLDAMRERLEAHGVEFTGATVDIPGVVRLATLADPDGNLIRLAEAPE